MLVTAVDARVKPLATSTDYVSCRQSFLGKKITSCVDNLPVDLAL